MSVGPSRSLYAHSISACVPFQGRWGSDGEMGVREMGVRRNIFLSHAEDWGLFRLARDTQGCQRSIFAESGWITDLTLAAAPVVLPQSRTIRKWTANCLKSR